MTITEREPMLTGRVFAAGGVFMFLPRLAVTPSLLITACIAWSGPRVVVAQTGQTDPLEHSGMCDASAAVTVSAGQFLVANDEDNRLRLYSRNEIGPPAQTFDLSEFLRVSQGSQEADIEGAARLGDRIFWVTSHGRNKNGKRQAARCAVFATDISGTGDRIQIRAAGRPYRDLLTDLLADERLAGYELNAAAQKAPKEEGALNIEGLAATREGTLLIGFRNPIPRGKALIVTLLNPQEIIAGSRARLGPPIELDLGGLGVRCLEFWPARQNYLIAAGHYDARPGSRLFLWSGKASDPPRPVEHATFRDWNVEAFVLDADHSQRIQLLSDDGGRQVEGRDCKSLADESQRKFRSVWVEIPGEK